MSEIDGGATLPPVAFTPQGRQRVRLGSLGEASATDGHGGGETEAIDPVETTAQAISKESLAYALPGGLAKLSIPKWIYAKHLKLLEDVILKIAKGKSVRVGVSMPPRHGKTQFLSRVVPAWYMGRFPDNRVLLITNHTNLSRKQGRYARNILDQFGDSVFGITVSDQTAAAGDWEIAGHEGGMEAVGAGSNIQGKGADLLLLDDIITGYKMAVNASQMDDVWEWLNTDVFTRLEPNASIILVNTRWSVLDPIGRLEEYMKQDKTYEHWDIVNLPALAGEDDPLGREVGEPLFPQRFSKKHLQAIQHRMDPYWYGALYDGAPSPAKGAIINIDWLQRYKEEPSRENVETVIISADTAMKETELSDYTVFGVWYIRNGAYYLVDVVRERMPYTVLRESAIALHNRWMPNFFLIEDKGSGTSLIQQLRAENPNIPVEPVEPGPEGKIIRMETETPEMRAGRVYVPQEGGASWLDDYVAELRTFPKGRKDQVDMTSQFLRFMRENFVNRIDMF